MATENKIEMATALPQSTPPSYNQPAGAVAPAQNALSSPQSNPQFNPQYNPQFSPQYNPQFSPQFNPQFSPQFNPQFNPQYNPQFSPVSPGQPIPYSPQAIYPGQPGNPNVVVVQVPETDPSAICKQRGHTPVTTYGPFGRIIAIFLFPIGLFALFLDRKTTCHRCGAVLSKGC